MWWGKGSNQDTQWMRAVANVTAVLSCLNDSVNSPEATIQQVAQNISSSGPSGQPHRSLKRSLRGEYADKAKGISQKKHKK
jgi:hypothetical protein